MDHTELPANTQHLPFLRISIRWRAKLLLTVSSIWLTDILLIPRPTEGWRLSWPGWLTDSGRLAHEAPPRTGGVQQLGDDDGSADYL